MKILLTGGNGFLGRWVFAALKADHHDVASPARERHDLTIHADTVRAFKEAQPDVVVHLAAIVGGIGANKARPADFFRENMQMALNVVEVARHYKAKVVSSGPSARIRNTARFRSRRPTYGTAIPRRRTRRTGLPRRRCL